MSESILKLGIDPTAVSSGADTATRDIERVKRAAEQTTSSIDRLQHYLKILAGGFAAFKVADTIREVALLNARFETLGVVLGVVGRNAGYNREEMEAFAKQVQKMGITMAESRDSVIKMAQAELDLNKASALARVAQDAAVIGNINSSEALSRIVHGIQSQQVEVLRTIGINISLEESYKRYAEQLKINTGALTAADKVQAAMNAVLEYGTKIAGTYEAAMGTAGKQLTSLARYSEDAKTKVGEVFNETLLAGVLAYTEHLKSTNKEIDELASNNQLKSWGEDLADTFAAVADAGARAVLIIRALGMMSGAAASRAELWGQTFKELGQVRSFADWQKVRQRHEERTAAQSQTLQQSLEENAAAANPFSRGLEQLRQQRRSDAAKLEQNADEYLAAQKKVAEAYASHPLDVQQTAQLSLAKSFFPQSYPEPRKPTARREDSREAAKKMEAQQSFLERFQERLPTIAYSGESSAVQETVKRELEVQKLYTDNAKLAIPLSKEKVQSMEAELRAAYALSDAGKERQRQLELEMESAKELEEAEKKRIDGLVEESKLYERIALVSGKRADDLVFEAQIFGKTAEEQKRLTEYRQIDLMVQNESVGRSSDFRAMLEALAVTMKEKVAGAFDLMREKQTKWYMGAEAAISRYEENLRDVASSTDKLLSGAFQRAEDALTKFLTTGKFGFKDFVNTIHAEITRQAVREDIMPWITKTTRAALPMIGSAFNLGGAQNDEAFTNASGGGGLESLFPSALNFILSAFDQGGIIGRPSPGGYRIVPASAFRTAKHMSMGGLIGGGIPIIGHKDEEVLTTKDPRHRFNGGLRGGSKTVNINVAVNETTSRQTAQDIALTSARFAQRVLQRQG